MTQEMLLNVSGLTIRFGAREVVHDLGFTLKQGETLALVGASGSGKTVSALTIPNLLPAPPQCVVSGSVKLLGQERVGLTDKQAAPARGSKVGVVFQEPMTALNPLHTIGRQLAEPLKLHTRLNQPQRRSRVLELLEEVGLPYLAARLDAYPHQLSGGERQRLMIAMAIACEPALLIADEPTTALDVTLQAQVLQLLKTLQKKMGMGLLFISHDLPLVRQFADRILVLQDGRKVEEGGAAEIFATPKHPYTKQLLAALLPDAPPAPVAKNKDDALLRLDHLSIAYAHARPGLFGWLQGPLLKPAVRDITLALPRGQTLGLVGESGSGKTTLALALLRLLPPKAKLEGPVVLLGQRLDQLQGDALRAIRKEVQLVFQDPYGSLNPRLTVAQIIGEGLEVHFPALTRAERETRVKKALQEVGLPEDAAHRHPHAFSGGQRQRIAIARAFVLEPSLLVLDEPTSALDVLLQAQILKLLTELQARKGTSFILISHDMRVICAMAHQVLVLKDGAAVEQGPASDVIGAPKADYTKTLLKAAYALQA